MDHGHTDCSNGTTPSRKDYYSYYYYSYICVVSLMFIMTKSRWSKSALYKKISPDVSAQRGIRRIFVAHQKLKF